MTKKTYSEVWLAISFLLLWMACPAVGQVIYVDADADGANHGSSWADAYNYLQDALAAASSGDEIWVAAGIYKADEDSEHHDGTGDRTARFQLINGVVMKGGYAGFGEADPNERDLEAHKTILSGDLLGDDVDVVDPEDLRRGKGNRDDNSYTIIRGSGTNESAVLDGFTITGAKAGRPEGAMRIYGGSPTVLNCTFSWNYSTSGGGMFIRGGSPTITNCTFISNSAGSGAGILNRDGNPTLTNCMFKRNKSGGRGGGIHNYGFSKPTLIGCKFIENSSGKYGGAMSNVSSSIGLGCEPTLINCSFNENSASGNGGGIYNSGAKPTLMNCLLRGNSARYGGGMYCWHYVRATLMNCTFGGNSASVGSALACDSLYNKGPSNVEISNCILWDGGNELWNDDGSTITVTYTNVQCGWEGQENMDEDPRFADLSAGNCHLLPSSPCINAGDPAGDYGGQSDIDGEPRVMLGRVDMGADEFPYESAVLLGLEIIGPNVVTEDSSAQYTAIASYEHDFKGNVTTWATWVLQPQECGSIDENGLLTTDRIEIPEAITIYAQYTEHEVTVEAEMTVHVSPLFGLELAGPNEVPENSQAQYNVTAYYANGDTGEVTASALWRVEPNTIGEIDANGLLRIKDVNEAQDIVIYAQYTAGGATLERAVIVEVFPPRIFYVPADYETIQAAIDASYDRDVVFVDEGTYTGDGNRDIDFGGRAITVRSIDPNDPNIVAATIIDCNGTEAEPHRGFYFHSGEDGNSIVGGFTITNGWSGMGGGMLCEQSSPTVSNCTFSRNENSGMCNLFWSSPVLTNCTFIENKGGGMYNLAGSNPVLTNCTFVGNNVLWGGGGMSNMDSSPVLTNCTFKENEAAQGGGMDNFGDCSPELTNCTFSGNQAVWLGGGIFNMGRGGLTLINCTFSGNGAGVYGGAINNSSPSLMLTNCTFRGNWADIDGGGICNYPTGASATLTNCILWDNYCQSYGTSERAQIYGGTSVVNYSCIEGWTGNLGGVGNTGKDPLLTPDGHLKAGSPCIEWSANGPADDRDGEIRPFPAGGGYDIGSDEFIDSDLDGLPDWWEEEYFGSTSAAEPNADPDMDGYTNLMEYELFSSDPTEGPKKIIFVDANATGNNDGSSWADAFNYLQDALAFAQDGNDIWVAEGVYKPDEDFDYPDGTGDRAASFELVGGVAMHGGFPAGGGDREDRDPDTYETILSGDLNGDDDGFINNDENSYHVVTGNWTSEPVFLNGAVVTGGNADGSSLGVGGGMYNKYGNPILTQCTFMGNSAYFGGGGMFNDYGSRPTLSNCTFIKNEARDGGGMYSYRSTENLARCTFSGNEALRGGGMYNWYSEPFINSCDFSGNLANKYEGGGMYNYKSSPRLSNCDFSENSADDGPGGGMCNYKSSATLTYCMFWKNSGRHGGGGICNDKSSSTLTNCMFSGNKAAGAAGLLNYKSSATLTNCTFNGNWGKYYVGGMSNGIESNARLTNCVFWGNIDSEGAAESAQIENFDAMIAINYCCVQGWTGGLGGTGNIDDDPCFVEPGYWVDVNDPNIVVEPNDPNATWVEGDYHLLGGSPCIDAGDNNSLPADTNDLDGDGNTTEPIPFDLDGELRFVDDPCTPDTGNGVPPIVDMGAFEFQLPDPVELLLGLMEKVVDLNLQHGIANSLSAKLDAALKLLEDDNKNNDVAAINLLQAFINAVEAQRGKKIPEAEADALIADALEIIDLAVFLKERLLQKLSADVAPDGGDGIVNFLDWASFANEWESTTNMEDLAVFVDQWLQHSAY